MTYPYDPKKAERLLDEAGYPKGPDGIRFKIGSDMAAGHHGLIRLCEVAREYLKAVGIDLVLQTHEMASFVDKVYVKWNSDTSHMAHGMQGDPNIGYARYLITSQIKQLPFVNCGGYSNPKVDEAFEQGGMELDSQKRIKYWHIIQEECAKDIPIIWFWDMPSPSAWDANFVGFPMGPSSWGENYANIWWKQGRDAK
jgi:peptide/nickel transport system substrate-binding protein